MWSAACSVFFTVTHITYAALVFKVNSLNVLFNRFITLYSLICTLFIWFPSSFSDLHSSFSNFSLGVIFYLQSLPLSLHYLLFSFVQLYILASAHTFFSVPVSYLWIQISYWPTWKYLFTGQECSTAPCTSLLPTLQSSSCLSCQCCLLPSILSSSLSPPSISLSLTALLQSLHPPLFCPAAQ